MNIKQILNIENKEERTRLIIEYMRKNIEPSSRCKANALNDAKVFFDGGLL